MKAKAILLVMLACASCSVPHQYTQADRDTFNAVANEYVNYVFADTKLTEQQKILRFKTIESWDKRILAAEDK